MRDVEMQKWMVMLGYSREWLELGLISGMLLQHQAAEWQAPDADHHPEHYRYAAWRAFVSRQEELPPALVSELLALDLHEAGLAGTRASSFGHGIAHDLAAHPRLTSETLALLRQHPLNAASFLRALDKAQARLGTIR